MIHYFTSNGVGNAWVANELSGMGAAQIPFVLHAMRKPDRLMHDSDWAIRINDDTRELYPLPMLPLLASLLAGPFLFGGRYFVALLNALFGRREHLRARIAGIAHFAAACHWARTLRQAAEPVTHIHSQWAHSCGTIAMYGGWLLDVPFSFTGHATDLFRDRCALEDKIRRADFIVCISEFHRSFYLENGARPEQLFIVYCGINPEWFHPPGENAAGDRTFRVLSSGRLVEKKGFAYLIEACRILADRGEQFECVIGGSGELEADLRAQVEKLKLDAIVTVTGKALQQERIIEFMHSGDVYVLPCVWATDNDVDGLPQMLMEAMACGLPAISTRLVGIPDLIRDGETGLLVEANDATGLADAISRLMHDRELAQRLARNGRQWVDEKFNLKDCLNPLIERFRQKLAATARRA